MPGMVEMFTQGNAELQGITQFMLDLSDFFKEYWLPLFVGVV
jgi:type II secretory pathway component PulF